MITVHDLNFTYPGAARQTLHHISFQVGEGEILSFLGPSGAGKSTTQKILIGLLKGYQGSVQVMGREIRDWGSDYYEQIGVSFELPNHYLKLTGLENLRTFAALYSRQTEDPRALLEQVGLGDAADAPVSQYSKGMKIRLNVARSLLNRPRLLFLDEPTSGLDPVNARIIKDLVLQKQSEGTTIIVTTHNMALADALSDRVAFIVDGRIQLIDTPSALKKQYGRRSVAVEYRNGTGTTHSQEFALEGLGSNADFLNVLSQYQIETLHTQETTLENIFLHVTGRDLA